MADFVLHIGNRNYSTWSLRGWLAARLSGVEFETRVIPLDLPDTAEKIAAVSPNRLVPCLEHGALRVWETMSIAEYLNEVRPDAGMWPEAPAERAMARSLAAEMHAGFAGVRSRCPMDMLSRIAPVKAPPEVLKDLDRLQEAWRGARSASGAAGPYLFGRWTLADAFFAPVASRCVTYGLPLAADGMAYVEAVLDHPHVREWTEEALKETWRIHHEDAAEQKF